MWVGWRKECRVGSLKDSGAISHKHLDNYLDEFTFRFNRRRSKSHGKFFSLLAQHAVTVKPVPLDRMMAA
jgi:hypothetical protein